MDPVSLTASLITILTAALQTLGGIDKLINLKDDSQRAFGLEKRVGDFRALLTLMKTVAGSRADGSADLQPFITNLETHTDQLERFVRRRFLGDTLRPSGNSKLSYSKFIRNFKHVHHVETDLEGAKATLTCLLGLLSMTETGHLKAVVDKIQGDSTTILSTNQDIQLGQGRIFQKVTDLEQNIQPIIHTTAQIQRTINNLTIPNLLDETAQATVATAATEPANDDQQGNTFDTSQLLGEGCSAGCRCRCHINVKRATPQFLESAIGILFYGQFGVPTFKTCNLNSCRREGVSQGLITYYFPTWLIAVGFQLFWNWKRPRLTMSLTFPRIVDGRSPIWTTLYVKDEPGVKDLFSKRLASPFDSFDSGVSVLHYALWREDYNMCRFLLQMGADKYFMSKEGRSPVDIAWEIILANPSGTAEIELRTIFSEGEEDYMLHLGFTALHKAAVGLYQIDIADYIRNHPQDFVNKVDNLGRTPVSYAASRNEIANLTALLDGGADISIGDHLLVLPIHNAASIGNAAALEKLLAAGAAVDAVTSKGHSALHEAVAAGSVDSVRLLLEHGAQCDTADALGRQPLYFAATLGHPEMVPILVQHGADVNAKRFNNSTALMEAFYLRRDDIARALVSFGANVDCIRGFTDCMSHTVDDCTCRALKEELQRLETAARACPLPDSTDSDIFEDALEQL